MNNQTQRSRLKAERRQEILRAAANLFADRGFRGVSIEDLGTAAGVTGPAVYRHFASKEAILAELLVGVSQRLLAGGRAQATATSSPMNALRRLVEFHTDFALNETELIRLQDRDFASLPPKETKTVRQLQRKYLEVWVEVLLRLDRTTTASDGRTKVQAVFGLLNSTPHSASNRDTEVTRRLLEVMAMAALLCVPVPND